MSMTEEARRKLIQERVKAHDPNKQEMYSLSWRDSTDRFPVISLELDAVVLRPDSHRIRAQLESHPEVKEINSEPYSEKSQQEIAEILRSTGENFDDLKRNLDEEGQEEFGVITRDGLLVNANRRTVALRDLGKKYIEVAVLPDDATLEEINDLELTLQVQRDFREDYTYTNRLLFVEELINKQNRTVEEVAKALNPMVTRDTRTMNKGKEEVEQDTRVLAFLREVQARSGSKIPLTDFDEQEVAIEELDVRHKDMAEQNPESAKQTRDIRLLGILAGVPYRRLRELDDTVLEKYVVPTLSENELIGKTLPALKSEVSGDHGGEAPKGLDVLEEDAEPLDGGGEKLSAATQVGVLVDIIATSHADEEVDLPTEDGDQTVKREVALENLKEALTDAAIEIKSDKRHDNKLTRPIELVEEAERKLKSAAEYYSDVKDASDFNSDKFSAALKKVGERLDALTEDAG
jgi:hypothetical protein